jgi:hypothetical protein
VTSVIRAFLPKAEVTCWQVELTLF